MWTMALLGLQLLLRDGRSSLFVVGLLTAILSALFTCFQNLCFIFIGMGPPKSLILLRRLYFLRFSVFSSWVWFGDCYDGLLCLLEGLLGPLWRLSSYGASLSRLRELLGPSLGIRGIMCVKAPKMSQIHPKEPPKAFKRLPRDLQMTIQTPPRGPLATPNGFQKHVQRTIEETNNKNI